MMFNERGLLLRALLLAGCALTGFSDPAQAQSSANADPELGADILDTPAGESGSIVVTGSRIQRRDYEANSPIVTIDESLLEQSSTAAIEQNLNRLPQFTPAKTPTQGGDIQPTATNTPGAATVSLRGIGANRNLVLLDGRRATPGNATGVVDINTIPSAAIERVEIISGGASATYGADAVAGVTNFILKRNFQGLELNGRIGISQEADGFEYQLSGIMGTDFPDGRGNVSLTMSMNTREASFQRDRDYFRDEFSSPGGATSNVFFFRLPGVNFAPGNPINGAVLNSVFDEASVPLPTSNINVFLNPDGSVFAGDSFATRGGTYRSQLQGDLNYRYNAAGFINPVFSDAYLILPLTRYNALARGNYEISDSVGVFGQAMFSQVETQTVQAPGPAGNGWAATFPYGNRTYEGDAALGIPSSLNADGTTNAAYLTGGQYGLDCPATGGCATYQVYPVPVELQQLLLARQNPEADASLRTQLPENRETRTDVTTYSLTAGLEGSIPGTDFTWEAFVTHGESSTFALQQGVYSLARLRAVVAAPNFGYGFEQQGNADNGGFGASTANCSTGLNFFQQQPFASDCLEAIRADLKNRSTVRQTIAEANVQGGLFELPAGRLRAAAGASYRELDYEFLNDTLTTQGRSFLDQALGIYPSGNSAGYYDVREVYGELLIPVLADVPGIMEFNLELGGRISDYSTTGTSYTYKALGDWRVTDWLRIRGGYNRAERAPNVAELFLAPQQTFGANNRGDVCSTSNPFSFSANPSAAGNNAQQAAAIQQMCRILMEQSGDPTADEQYYDSGNPQPSGASGTAFPTTIGNPNLKPEIADTYTAGVVVNSPFRSEALAGLRLSVDWYRISVEDAIGVQTVGSALQQCFDPALNPLVLSNPEAAANTQFCQNVPRNTNGGLGNVSVTYVNNGRFRLSGIDATLDWSMPVGPGRMTLNSVFNYMLEFASSDLPTNPLVDYIGTFGTAENGLNEGVFEYRVITTLGYSLGGARAALQWEHRPSIDATASVLNAASTQLGAPAYNLFNLNAGYELTEDVSLSLGVDNLFNKRPPLTNADPGNDPAVGLLPSGVLNGTFYDTQGRRFYLGANVRF